MIVQELLGPNGFIYSTEDEDGNVKIFWGGRLYYSYNRDDSFLKRLGMVILAGIGVLQKTICELFKVNRKTVRNVIEAFNTGGVEGLKNYKQGPQPVTEELKAFVIKKYIELNNKWGYQDEILKAIMEKVEEGIFSKGISRSKLQKIIREHKDQIEEQKKKAEEKAKALKNAKAAKEEKKRDLQKKVKIEEEDKQQPELPMRDEECVEHGGASAVIPIVQQYGINDFLPYDLEGNDRLFKDTEMAVIYTALNAAELVKVEQDFKLLPSYQMGGIIGRVKLPSLSLYRNRIPQVVENMDMNEVILETAKKAHAVLGFSKILYIDGHFMPYYGDSHTLYGYNSQRRLAMPGREYYFVHDENGLPVYAVISDGYRDMKHYIKKVDDKLRKIFGVKDKELLEVFDRGGYSKDFCVGISKSIRFICWRSDAKKVPEIPHDEWVKVIVNRQANCFGKVKKKRFKAWERMRFFSSEGKKAKMREVWIKDGKKVSPALTNDFTRSLGEVVASLTRRWGAQENMFKELKNHGIDRIHSYQKEKYSEEFLFRSGLEDEAEGVCHEIDNPKKRKINKEISRLRDKRRRLLESLEKHEKKGNKSQQKKIMRKIAGLDRKISSRINKRKRIPNKIRMMDRIEQDKIVRLADSKKLFFDWLKMNGIWAKRELVEVVKPYYEDLRDVNKFVRSILRSRTYLQRKGDKLYVSFPPQQSEKAQMALEAVCDFLNEMNAIDLNLSFKSIIFRVGEKH